MIETIENTETANKLDAFHRYSLNFSSDRRSDDFEELFYRCKNNKDAYAYFDWDAESRGIPGQLSGDACIQRAIAEVRQVREETLVRQQMGQSTFEADMSVATHYAAKLWDLSSAALFHRTAGAGYEDSPAGGGQLSGCTLSLLYLLVDLVYERIYVYQQDCEQYSEDVKLFFEARPKEMSNVLFSLYYFDLSASYLCSKQPGWRKEHEMLRISKLFLGCFEWFFRTTRAVAPEDYDELLPDGVPFLGLHPIY